MFVPAQYRSAKAYIPIIYNQAVKLHNIISSSILAWRAERTMALGTRNARNSCCEAQWHPWRQWTKRNALRSLVGHVGTWEEHLDEFNALSAFLRFLSHFPMASRTERHAFNVCSLIHLICYPSELEAPPAPD